MSRLYFLVAFVALATVAIAEEKIENIDVQFVDDFNKFRSENAGIKVTPLSLLQSEGQFRYTFGRRVDGDGLIAQAINSTHYPALKDVQVRLNYPTSGIGKIVSYVEIGATQSSTIAAAYVVSGGVGLMPGFH